MEENLCGLFSLEDKTILLTGAAGGIGNALAKGLAGAGGEMLLCDIAADRLNELQKDIQGSGGKAHVYHLDMSDRESIRSIVSDIAEDIGCIDVLMTIKQYANEIWRI